MYTLTARLHVGEEAGVRLLVAVEVGVRHRAQHRVVRARLACNTSTAEQLISMCVIILLAFSQYLGSAQDNNPAKGFWLFTIGCLPDDRVGRNLLLVSLLLS